MKTNCPVCNGKNTMDVITRTENIPYFGDIMESLVSCQKCGYKHSDVICLEQKTPIRYALTIKKDKLSTRVVKSQTATISIPELGLKVEPGPKSIGYVSNIEGVLNRFQEAVETAINLFEDDESQKNGKTILKQIEDVRIGNMTVEIIIEDPFGHSVIAHPEVDKRELTLDEIKNLKTGFTTFDQDEFETN
jgi:zinc finger protein